MKRKQTASSSVAFTTEASMAVTARLFKPMPDGHPCYTLVGQIAAEAARIERLLDNSIAAAAGLDPPISACITSQLSGTNPRFDALRKLLGWKGLGAEFDSKLKDMKKKTGEDMTPRNAAVHDPWLIDEETGAPHQQRAMRKQQIYGLISNDERELGLTLDRLRKRRETLSALLNTIWERTRP
jgi:hypothetical protein